MSDTWNIDTNEKGRGEAKPVTIRIGENHRDKLKVLAARAKRPMRTFLEELIDLYGEDHMKRLEEA